MKVLITGISGFVGKNLRQHLPSGHEYFFLVHSSSLPPEGMAMGKGIIQGDINDLNAVKHQLMQAKPDVCIHLAWEGIPDYGYEASVKNLKNGLGLFEFLVKECGCRKIISVGSCWEYGKNFGLCTETDPVGTGSYFVWAKRALCDFGFSLVREEKIDFIWLRFFYVYGPGQREGALIPTLVRALRNNESPSIRTPLDANDYVHIDDAVGAIVKAAFGEISSGIHNVGSGQSVPVWRVCAMIEENLKSNSSYFERLKRSSGVQMADFWADTQSAMKVLGWQAKKPFEDGIKEYLKAQGAY